MSRLFSSSAIGLALSGGGPRGLAHIGVAKALEAHGIEPAFIAGTSAGSIVGALLAAGRSWREIRAIAASTFWPELFDGDSLERFCARHLPATFAGLERPFVAIAGEWPSRRMVVLRDGDLPSAVSASCALPGARRPVIREGLALLDGGLACPLPSVPAREMGATCVVASDVLGIASVLRAVGMEPTAPAVRRFLPNQYRRALDAADVLIAPAIPLSGMLPLGSGLEAVIAAGEAAARAALSQQLQRSA